MTIPATHVRNIPMKKVLVSHGYLSITYNQLMSLDFFVQRAPEPLMGQQATILDLRPYIMHYRSKLILNSVPQSQGL